MLLTPSAPTITVAEIDAQVRGPLAQQIEQPLARDPAEAVTGRADGAAAHMDIDVVPVREVARDLLMALGIGAAKVLERRIGEHHAPPERVVRRVPLQHRDRDTGIRASQQQRQIQTCGPTADHHHLHRVPSRKRPNTESPR
jgi:hypothetical protein